MIGVTFCTPDYTISAKKCVDSMYKHGCKTGIFYSSSFLPISIQNKFADQRGYGFWQWKAIIINSLLDLIEENEILIYADAGVEVIDNLNYIVDRMDQDVFLFGNMWDARHWTKGDIYKAIGVEPNDSKQTQASVIILRNTEFSRKFISEWLHYCQIPQLINDDHSIEPNHPEFKENRHDQAILHVLSEKYGIKKHWWPAKYITPHGTFIYEKGIYADNYPVLFHHHRKKNDEWQR